MTRLDTVLVRRSLARSRGHAAELIAGGRVRVDGRVARRAATPLQDGQRLEVEAGDDLASRGGGKLAGALDALAATPAGGPAVAGRVCLDAGASTGGFTDVLLRRGAVRVVAVDVGHDQLRPELRADPRVVVRDGVNVRDLTAADLAGDHLAEPGRTSADPATPDDPREPASDLAPTSALVPELVVADPSAAVAARDAYLLVLVKPQFEVGRERLGSGGVVRDPALHAWAVRTVAAAAAEAGLGVLDVVASPLPGPAGNREFFCWLRRGAPGLDAAAVAALADRVAAAAHGSPIDTTAGEASSRPTTRDGGLR